MKTIVDAVNALRGDIELGISVYYGRILDFVVSTSIKPREDNFYVKFLDGTGAQFSCAEFNQCVAEMTEGLFVPLFDLNKREGGETEILTDRDGNQYQKGKRYLFSDDGDNWVTSVLQSIAPEYGRQFFTAANSANLMHCKVDDSEAGTITKAPLVLEDGAAYQFDYSDGSTGMNDAIMRYSKAGDYFFFDNVMFDRKHCTNIIKLVTEVK